MNGTASETIQHQATPYQTIPISQQSRNKLKNRRENECDIIKINTKLFWEFYILYQIHIYLHFKPTKSLWWWLGGAGFDLICFSCRKAECEWWGRSPANDEIKRFRFLCESALFLSLRPRLHYFFPTLIIRLRDVIECATQASRPSWRLWWEN